MKTTTQATSEPKILRVVWRDACSEEASTLPGEAVSGLVELVEVGFLVAESEESITLGMELSAEAHPGRWRLHIPRNSIVTIQTLSPGRKRK